jgi:hypothetical protein
MLCITESTFSIPDSNPEFRMGGSYTPGCAASSSGHYFIPDYLITYPEVPSFVRRTEFFYRVPRIIIKSVNITVFPHLYKFPEFRMGGSYTPGCAASSSSFLRINFQLWNTSGYMSE